MGWWFPNIDKMDKEVVKKIKKYYTGVDNYNRNAENYNATYEYLSDIKKSIVKAEMDKTSYKEKLAKLEWSIIPLEYEHSLSLKHRYDYLKQGNFDVEIKAETALRVSKLEKPDEKDASAVKTYKAKCKLIAETAKNDIILQKKMELLDIKEEIKKDKNYNKNIKVFLLLVEYGDKLEATEVKLEHLRNTFDKNLEFFSEAKEYCKANKAELAQLYSEIKDSLPKEQFEALDLERMVKLKGTKSKMNEEAESDLLVD